jgi:hypothetical protein
MNNLRDFLLRFLPTLTLCFASTAFSQTNALDTIRNALEQCRSVENSERNLSERILIAAEQNAKDQAECRAMPAAIIPISYDLEQVAKELKAKSTLDFQRAIYEQAMKNMVSRLVYFMYAFESKENPTLFQNNFYLKREINSLCTDSKGKSACSTELIDRLFNHATDFLAEIKKSGVTPLSYSEVRDDINRRIDDLNTNYLAPITVSSTVSMTLMDKASHDEKTKEKHRAYVKRYQDLSSYGPGILLHSEVLANQVGGERLLEEDLEKSNSVTDGNRSYLYKLHPTIDTQTAKLATQSIHFVLKKEAEYLRDLSKNTDYFENRLLRPRFNKLVSTKDDVTQNNERFIKNEMNPVLKKLMITHPGAVGQVLLDSPEFSEYTCTLISQISAEEERTKSIRDFFDHAGNVLSATSLLTGYAGISTRFLFIGATKLAAKSAGVTAGSLSTYTATTLAGGTITASGIMAGVGGGTSLIKNSFTIADQLHMDQRYDAAYVTGNGDESSLEESKHSLEVLDHAANEAVISGAETAASFLLVPRGNAIRKFGSIKEARKVAKTEKEDFMNNLLHIEKYIDAHPDLKLKFKAIRNAIASKHNGLREEHLNAFMVDIIEKAGKESIELHLLRLKRMSTPSLVKEIKTAHRTIDWSSKSAKLMNEINPEQLIKVYHEVKRSGLQEMVSTLATDFEVTELEMMKRVAKAKVSVTEIANQLRNNQGMFSQILRRYEEVKNNPEKLRKFLYEEDGLKNLVLMPYRTRVHIANDDLKKTVATFLAIEMAMSAYNEKSKRGKQFWNQLDRFSANLINVSLIEIALTLTGANSIRGATQFMKTFAPNVERIPVNIFGKWNEYTLAQRGKRFVRDATRNQAIAATTSWSSNVIVAKAAETEEERSLNAPSTMLDRDGYIVSTTSFMTMSSNPRYYAINLMMSNLKNRCKNRACDDFVRSILPTAIAAANDSFGIRTGITWQNMMDENIKELKAENKMSNPVSWSVGASNAVVETASDFTKNEILDAWLFERWANVHKITRSWMDEYKE